MPRLSDHKLPKYRLHKRSNSAVVSIAGRAIHLGKWNSPESQEAYRRIIAEWVSNGRALAPPIAAGHGGPLVGELIVAYMEHAKRHYQRPTGETLPDGSAERVTTSQIYAVKSALRVLVELYGETHAEKFGPRQLVTVQNAMIKRGWCVRTINGHVSRVRNLFRWASKQGLLNTSIAAALHDVDGLRPGRTEAPTHPPIGPVDDSRLAAVLPHLSIEVAAMIQLQRVTAMRPGEVCSLRWKDIDRRGDVWVYRPPHHKTKHHGKTRAICLGARAQELLAPFRLREPDAFVFCPAAAVGRMRLARAKARTTPLSCGNGPGDNRSRSPKRSPGDCYTSTSYTRAIKRGCALAFPAPGRRLLREIAAALSTDQKLRRAESMKAAARLRPDLVREIKEHDAANAFHANQIRHAAADEIDAQFGIEALSAVMGHSSLKTTQIYLSRDLDKAVRVAAAMG